MADEQSTEALVREVYEVFLALGSVCDALQGNGAEPKGSFAERIGQLMYGLSFIVERGGDLAAELEGRLARERA